MSQLKGQLSQHTAILPRGAHLRDSVILRDCEWGTRHRGRDKPLGESFPWWDNKQEWVLPFQRHGATVHMPWESIIGHAPTSVVEEKSSGGTRTQRSFARDGMYKCRNSITLLKREGRGRILAEIFRVCFYAPEKHVFFATDMKRFTWDKSIEGHTFSKTGSEYVKMFRLHCICFLTSNPNQVHSNFLL